MNPREGRVTRQGGALLLLGAVLFTVGMVVAIVLYGPPPYSFRNTSISDLQAIYCGSLDGQPVCSPGYLFANAAVFLAGTCLMAGVLRGWRVWAVRGGSSRGPGLLILGGAGAVANAFTPADVTLIGDAVTAYIAFVGANLGLVVLSRHVSSTNGWNGYSLYSYASGVVGLAALLAYSLGLYGALGNGGIEWVITLPIILWMGVSGVVLSRGQIPFVPPKSSPSSGNPSERIAEGY